MTQPADTLRDPGASPDGRTGVNLPNSANPGEPYANTKPGTASNSTVGEKPFHPNDGADAGMMQIQQTEAERARKAPDGIGTPAEPEPPKKSS